MIFSLKHIVPLAIRTRLKWLGYAMHDIIDPIKTPRVPPRRRTFIGGGGFESVGEDFLKTLQRHGLNPKMDVLDVGCGQGRMARPLVGKLDQGSYTGFDIVEDGVDWCRDQYADIDNFIFLHADVFNERYNAAGSTAASNYVFPFDNDRFDRTFLTSVFTHMFKGDVENYLSEIGRTLKPGGTSLITWFLTNEGSINSEHTKMDFRFDVDDVSKTTLKQNPEAAIAFDEAYVRRLYQSCGLEIIDIEYGVWARPDSSYQFQDMIIARKS